MKEQTYLSVVIPARNEEEFITKTLDKVSAFLAEYGHPYEIIVIEDASTDGTLEACMQASRDNPNIRIIKNDVSRGKGAAVRRGVLASQGQFVHLVDADSSYPIEQVDAFIQALRKTGDDIAIGCRRLEESRFTLSPVFFPYIFQRHFMGLIYNLFTRIIAGIEQRDTQCGFKCFKGDVARVLFKKSVCNGFAFDVEILFLARKFGYRVMEMPIHYLYFKQRSSIQLVKDSFTMFLDLLRIRRNKLRGLYD